MRVYDCDTPIRIHLGSICGGEVKQSICLRVCASGPDWVDVSAMVCRALQVRTRYTIKTYLVLEARYARSTAEGEWLPGHITLYRTQLPPANDVAGEPMIEPCFATAKRQFVKPAQDDSVWNVLRTDCFFLVQVVDILHLGHTYAVVGQQAV